MLLLCSATLSLVSGVPALPTVLHVAGRGMKRTSGRALRLWGPPGFVFSSQGCVRWEGICPHFRHMLHNSCISCSDV